RTRTARHRFGCWIGAKAVQSPLRCSRRFWHYETFIVRWHDRSLDADAYVTFELTPEGKIDKVRMKAVSPATDFSFDFHHLRLAPVFKLAAGGPAQLRAGPSEVMRRDAGHACVGRISLKELAHDSAISLTHPFRSTPTFRRLHRLVQSPRPEQTRYHRV